MWGYVRVFKVLRVFKGFLVLTFNSEFINGTICALSKVEECQIIMSSISN